MRDMTKPRPSSNDMEELWYHKTRGNLVMVYERNTTYVRFCRNNKSDMAMRGHEQWDTKEFAENYEYYGEILKADI